MTDRRDLLRLSGVLLALLVVTGAVLLATGGGSDSSGGGSAPGPEKVVDGLVLEATPERLRLRPDGGTGEMTFLIRATERPKFGVYHLQQHSADGLLTRGAYEQDGSTLYALWAEDAPPPPGG